MAIPDPPTTTGVPDAPSRADSARFAERADTFLIWIVQFRSYLVDMAAWVTSAVADIAQSVSAAATSASNSAGSATASANSAANSAASATSAAASATNSANSATASANSASNAAASATASANSATSAASSASSAANASRLSVGTITTGAAGSSAVVSISGAAGAQQLNLTIPRGNTGATGPSAYDVAVANGFVGSQADWLQSLEDAASIFARINAFSIAAGTAYVDITGDGEVYTSLKIVAEGLKRQSSVTTNPLTVQLLEGGSPELGGNLGYQRVSLELDTGGWTRSAGTLAAPQTSIVLSEAGAIPDSSSNSAYRAEFDVPLHSSTYSGSSNAALGTNVVLAWRIGNMHSGKEIVGYGSPANASTTCNGLRIFLADGAFAAGRITVYGVRR